MIYPDNDGDNAIVEQADMVDEWAEISEYLQIPQRRRFAGYEAEYQPKWMGRPDGPLSEGRLDQELHKQFANPNRRRLVQVIGGPKSGKSFSAWMLCQQLKDEAQHPEALRPLYLSLAYSDSVSVGVEDFFQLAHQLYNYIRSGMSGPAISTSTPDRPPYPVLFIIDDTLFANDEIWLWGLVAGHLSEPRHSKDGILLLTHDQPQSNVYNSSAERYVIQLAEEADIFCPHDTDLWPVVRKANDFSKGNTWLRLLIPHSEIGAVVQEEGLGPEDDGLLESSTPSRTKPIYICRRDVGFVFGGSSDYASALAYSTLLRQLDRISEPLDSPFDWGLSILPTTHPVLADIIFAVYVDMLAYMRSSPREPSLPPITYNSMRLITTLSRNRYTRSLRLLCQRFPDVVLDYIKLHAPSSGDSVATTIPDTQQSRLRRILLDVFQSSYPSEAARMAFLYAAQLDSYAYTLEQIGVTYIFVGYFFRPAAFEEPAQGGRPGYTILGAALDQLLRDNRLSEPDAKFIALIIWEYRLIDFSRTEISPALDYVLASFGAEIRARRSGAHEG